MRVIYPNLDRKLVEHGVSIKDLSDILCISTADVEKKLQGQLPWKLTEAVKICIHLRFPDVKLLFVQLDTNT